MKRPQIEIVTPHRSKYAQYASSLARRAALTMAVLLSFAAIQTWAAVAADFYKGKQINFVVSADVGESYDTFARMIAQFIPKYVPGSPAVVVQNMPGAGGMRATNWLYNVAPRDGLTIGMINNTLAFDPLYGDPLAQFDPKKFVWLGSPSKESALFIVWHSVPVDTIEQAKRRRLILSATGTGSTPAFYARVLASIFGLNIQIIPGYKSQGEAFLAMQRGENDGNASPFWSSMTSDFPNWVPEKKIKILLYYGENRDPAIPGPYVFDLIKDPAKRSLMQVAQAGLAMGRPLLAPPGVDPGKVQILRMAVDKIFKDPAYLAECKKAHLNCNSPSTGLDLLRLIGRTYDAPKATISEISAIYMEGQKK